jgi:anti-anti-sigma factor
MVLDIDGSLTAEADTRRVHEFVRSLTRRDASHLVLDLGHVRRLDSCGIGQLVTVYNELQALGVPLTLVNVEPHQKRLLQVAGLLAVFPVFDSRQEAMACFGSAAASRGLAALDSADTAGDGHTQALDLVSAHAW